MTKPLGIGIEEPPDRNGAFPRLDDEQRARLLAVGELRKVVPGEVLFKDGDDSYDFFVVESGAVTIVRGLGDENHVIAIHGRHRFLGELNLLTGGRVYLSAVVRDGGEVIQVPIDNLRRLVADDEELSNSAGQAAMFMSQHAASCRLMIRGGDLNKSMSRYLVDEIENNERVEVVTYHEVVELVGDQELEAVVVSDTRTGERHQLAVQALFVFIGADPRTDWLRGHVAMDDHGFVLAGRDIPDEQLSGFDGDRPYFLETSQPGIFAVGDARSGSVKRVASAVGEGSMAVRLVHQRLAAR